MLKMLAPSHTAFSVPSIGQKSNRIGKAEP